MPDMINHRDTHCHHDGHDGHDDHDLDQRETVSICVPLHFLSAPKSFPPERAAPFQCAMFDVIANMAESTLTRRNPTPRAIIMIITGSIMLVSTRKAMASSFS